MPMTLANVIRTENKCEYALKILFQLGFFFVRFFDHYSVPVVVIQKLDFIGITIEKIQFDGNVHFFFLVCICCFNDNNQYHVNESLSHPS